MGEGAGVRRTACPEHFRGGTFYVRRDMGRVTGGKFLVTGKRRLRVTGHISLVENAGYGFESPFEDEDPERFREGNGEAGGCLFRSAFPSVAGFKKADGN